MLEGFNEPIVIASLQLLSHVIPVNQATHPKDTVGIELFYHFSFYLKTPLAPLE